VKTAFRAGIVLSLTACAAFADEPSEPPVAKQGRTFYVASDSGRDNAGHGWGHAQRPAPNGRHLMFYHNSAKTSDFFVCKNIFAIATESCLRMNNEWTAGLAMDRNCWFQPSGVLAQYLTARFAPGQFVDYQRQSTTDRHSVASAPRFLSSDALDFRLADDSPARNLAGSRIPAGSRKRLEK